MTGLSDENRREAINIARELAQLEEQATQARVELELLRHALIEAEKRLSNIQAVQNAKASEQLALSTTYSQLHTGENAAEPLEPTLSVGIDSLTELPNRALMLDRFEQAILISKRHGVRLAMLSVDINNFKEINDRLGHAVGNHVLQQVASSLVHLVRQADTVSYYGGNDFLLLITELSQTSDVILVAHKVIETISSPCRVDEHVIQLVPSIGISIYPDDGEDAQTLIDKADAAMYRAKELPAPKFAFHGTPPPNQRSLQPGYEVANRSVAPNKPLPEHERRHALLREANGQLVLAVITAQELQAAAEQAKAKQAQFMGVLAHELRHPLAPIRNAAAILGKIPINEPRLAKLQAVIDRQVAHMSRLVSDLLDISRVDSGKLRLRLQIVEMTTLINEAIDTCRPAIETRQQKLNVQIPDSEIEVNGDPVRLVQILSNLLDNASKYTLIGGVIGLSAVVEGQKLVMTVSDNGIGITAEALLHVFEPFVQDIHATAFNGFGLGIGLTVVRELVEAHGGKVVASSNGNGLGSQFVVTLPLHEQPINQRPDESNA